MQPQVRYQRRSARVLLLDDGGRILLLRCLRDSTDPGLGYVWVTPGGGVHDGESLELAAARELREEIGLMIASRELGAPVAYTAGVANLGWVSGLLRDDFFYYHVGVLDVDLSGMTVGERSYHTGHRWWTVNELDSTSDVVYPFALAPLVRELLAHQAPACAIRLPWHHADVG